jgi:molecular chaperone GrpE
MNSPESPDSNHSTSSEATANSRATGSPSESELLKKIQDLEAQLKEKDNKYVYLYADFENFKKRAIKERSDVMKFGWESLARELVQVIDNLERALAHMPANTDKTLGDGLHMVMQQLRTAMQKQGVQRVDSVNQSFDPNLHEAVSEEPSEKPPGTIVREELKGYTLHGRLLRPSQVVVSAAKAGSAD